jgi:trk system potassium uptake protein TrkH
VRSDRRDYRGVAQQVGAVMMGLALAAFICGAVGSLWNFFDPLEGRPAHGGVPLYLTGCLSLLVGAPLFRYGQLHASKALGRRDAVLAVSLIWIVAGVCGGLPFVFGADMDPASAYFEAISGFTTTGATVIADIDTRLSRTLLLWRSLIQWLGGMGIVVLFVAVFPNVGAGGKHLFKGEVPGTSAEGLKPRIRETSYELWKIYVALTLLEALLLVSVGLDSFDAICHSFTTMATGGFSTRDASVAAFHSPPVEYIIATFMLLGSVNFGLYWGSLQERSPRSLLRNFEFRAFVGIVGLSVLLITLYVYPSRGDLESSFRSAYFMVSNVISSSGFGKDDYMSWPSPAITIIVFLMLMGGCSGSTAGGMKVERVLLLAKQALSQVKKSYRPSAVQLVRMGRQVVSAQILEDVSAFFLLYMGSIAVGVMAVTVLDGVPPPTAFGACISCLGNSGPHPFWIGADNFASYSPASKLVLSWLMLLGRLEFYTLLALFVPGFWRR